MILSVLYCCNVVPHGFAGHTVIGLKQNQEVVHIKDISSWFLRGKTTDVCTYKEKTKKWKVKSVQAVAHCQAEAFYELSFVSVGEKELETIQCSPLQLFYRAVDQAWVAAHELSVGDWLLCQNNNVVQLQAKQYVQDPILLYIIEVKKYHTFIVGRHKILTHNMFIPLATTIGMAIPFDIVFSAGSFGAIFGPVSFCCSVAIAGVAAAITYQATKKKCTHFSLIGDASGWDLRTEYNNAKGLSDAQAPGKPTEKDGFIPKKNWDGEKVPNPNGPGCGWPDRAGNVWVPSGPKGHGGPHWDVQRPGKGKRYANIMPGGHERGKK